MPTTRHLHPWLGSEISVLITFSEGADHQQYCLALFGNLEEFKISEHQAISTYMWVPKITLLNPDMKILALHCILQRVLQAL